MSIYAFTALVNFFACAVIASFVWRKGRGAAVNRSFSLFASFCATWSAAYFFWQVSADETSALLWCRVLMAGAIFIPIGFLQFCIDFIGKTENRARDLATAYIIAGLFLVLDTTDMIVAGVRPIMTFDHWPIAGILFGPFLLYWVSYVVYGSLLLFKHLAVVRGTKHTQIQYILWGTLIGFAGGATNYFLWFGIKVPPVGNIFVTVYVGLLAYAIVRYRLMDIRVMERRVFMYLGLGLVSYLCFYGIAWLHAKYFGGIFTLTSYLAGLFIAPFFVFVINKVIIGLEKVADTYLFADIQNYRDVIAATTRQLASLSDEGDVARLVSDSLRRALGISEVVVYVGDKESGLRLRVCEGVKAGEVSLKKHLDRVISETAEPIILDEPSMALDGTTMAARNALLENNIAVVVPIVRAGIVRGLLALGQKGSGDAYSNNDIVLLNTLATQTAVSLENAAMYKKIKQFNSSLKKKIEEQTREITAKANKLEKLLKMKSEFLDIASHQLKTPISVIMGTVSMMKEGLIGKLPPEEQAKFVDNIYIKSRKLSRIVRDILQASEIDAEEFGLPRERVKRVDVSEILKRVVASNAEDAKTKGLLLTYNDSSSGTAFVEGDGDYLEQAFGNLVENAITYTEKGGVRIDLSVLGGSVVANVSDTGVGIPKKDEKRIFGKFARASNAVNLNTDGSGLGLFITKEIIASHPGGSIGFVSKDGGGTTFTVKILAIK